MIFADDEVIKIDSVVLPGLLKSIEVKGDAQVEEQEIEGNSKKPKQAIGYEDSKINIELILEDDDLTVDGKLSRFDKLVFVQQLFKRQGQDKPEIHQIICEDTVSRGVSQVILKNMTHKTENKKQQIVVSLEFWEYTSITITSSKTTSGKKKSTKTKSSNDNASSGLTKEFRNYLPSRGAAPKLGKTPAQDSGALTVNYLLKVQSILGK